MSESNNNDNGNVENRGENLVNTTNEYNENERPEDESESILDETVDKVKAGTKAVINKVKESGQNLNSEYNNEKTEL